MKHHSLDHSHQILTLKSAEFWFDSLSWQFQREIFSSFFNEIKIVKLQSLGWGFCFLIASAQIGEKNPTPLGVLARNPCKPLYSVSFFNIVTPDHSLTLTKQKRSHPQLPNLKIETNNQLNVER